MRFSRTAVAALILSVVAIPATTLSASAATVPDAPTNVQATAGRGSATVTYTASASNGGAAIDDYKTCAYIGSTNTNLCTDTATYASPVVVSGLTSGQPYSFKTKTHNSVGWGASSAPMSYTVTPTGGVPGQVLNLTNWKITLPTGSSGSPTEITQPTLNTYSDSNFFTNAAGTGVTFKAAVNGTTTSGSSYPRSELREMTNNGASLASWGVNDGKTHTMTYTGSVDVLPGLKPQTVIGQIHDSSDDVIEVMGDGVNAASGQTDITFRYNGSTQSTHLITNYTLGTQFTVKIVAAAGQYKIYMNGTLKATITDSNSTHSGLYFKAGDYTQANTSNGTGYGQTTLYALSVTHV